VFGHVAEGTPYVGCIERGAKWRREDKIIVGPSCRVAHASLGPPASVRWKCDYAFVREFKGCAATVASWCHRLLAPIAIAACSAARHVEVRMAPGQRSQFLRSCACEQRNHDVGVHGRVFFAAISRSAACASVSDFEGRLALPRGNITKQCDIPLSGAAVGSSSGGGPSWPPCASGLAAVAPLDWPKGTTWLLKWVSQPHIHTHYLVR
jgi:hypothetical protein